MATGERIRKLRFAMPRADQNCEVKTRKPDEWQRRAFCSGRPPRAATEMGREDVLYEDSVVRLQARRCNATGKVAVKRLNVAPGAAGLVCGPLVVIRTDPVTACFCLITGAK